MLNLDELRAHLFRALEWGDAHATFDAATKDVAANMRGQQPPGQEHTLWQLTEHLRLAQEDILDFCVNANYAEREFPEGYWPPTPAPPSDAAWDESLARIRRDRQALQQLALDSGRDLFATIPHGTGQTYLRELLLVIDHNAYHVGQIILARRALGIWPPT
ncbi:MAG: DinB family protein [Gemmatimonadaceae bacterium]